MRRPRWRSGRCSSSRSMRPARCTPFPATPARRNRAASWRSCSTRRVTRSRFQECKGAWHRYTAFCGDFCVLLLAWRQRSFKLVELIVDVAPTALIGGDLLREQRLFGDQLLPPLLGRRDLLLLHLDHA